MPDLLVIALGIVAALAAAGFFAIALRPGREETGGTDWRDGVDDATLRADRGRIELAAAGAGGDIAEAEAAVAVIDEEPPAVPAEVGEPELAVAEVVRYREVPEDQQGINRRMFLNRALGATFFLWLASLGGGILAFMWPKVTGGFGADIDAGDAAEILTQVLNPDGTVTPLFVPEARSWVVRLADESVPASQFSDNSTVAGGLVAIFQTCVHLGCRVPWCASSQGFECPCHGSKFNSVGEYDGGPAPRNLDRFTVSINDANRFIISTGSIIATSRAQEQSVTYPQGPSCI